MKTHLLLSSLVFLLGWADPRALLAGEWTDPLDSTVAGTDVLSGSATVFEGMIDLRLRFAAEPLPVDRISGIGWCLDADQNWSTGTACGGSTYLGADGWIGLQGRPGAISTCDFELSAGRGTADSRVIVDYHSSLWYDPDTFTLRVLVPLAVVSDLDTPFNYTVIVSSSGAGDLAPYSAGNAFMTPGGFFTNEAGPLPPFDGPQWCARRFSSVDIDIEPGRPQNVVSLPGRRNIQVAILSKANFDAAALEVPTARFGPTGAEAPALDSASEDVDGDGIVDLVLTFGVEATGIRCGDTSATITASRADGYAVSGSGPIRTVGCR